MSKFERFCIKVRLFFLGIELKLLKSTRLCIQAIIRWCDRVIKALEV